MIWYDIKRYKPIPKTTPYSSYLVWVRGPKGKVEDGFADMLRFNNKTEEFDISCE